jgi:hypothetical protein
VKDNPEGLDFLAPLFKLAQQPHRGTALGKAITAQLQDNRIIRINCPLSDSPLGKMH